MAKKTPAELITEEFLDHMFQDVSRSLPDGMDGFTRRSSKIRLIRERLLAKLAEA